jgi:hypothetical protein
MFRLKGLSLNILNYLVLILLVIFTNSFKSWAQIESRRVVRPYETPQNFIRDLALVLEENDSELIEILTKVNNVYGSHYEINQAKKTLRGFDDHEWSYLKNIDREKLERVSVFASRNTPLYTIIQHALIPSTVAKKVFLRTPTISRAIYEKIFELIKNKLPQYNFEGVEFLDHNYDDYLNRYVLGLSGAGKSRVDQPSDVIIFTGDFKTANGITEKIIKHFERSQGNYRQKCHDQKTNSPESSLKPLNQLFLKFGVGLNPLVVSPFADKDIDRAVKATCRSILINSGQDCTAPKLILVDKKFINPYLSKLLMSIRKMKFGENNDPHADYSPLTYTQGDKFNDLIEFKKLHLSNLQNQNALILKDESLDTNRVDPHVFLFPFEDFKNVQLKDHFAPFIVIFTYENEDQLKIIASDPRLQAKAMYASIFGDITSTDTNRIRRYFDDNFMSTVMNLDVFDEEAGYHPFGGRGVDSSEVTKLILEEGKTLSDNKVVTSSAQKPLLFSKEAMLYFPKKEKDLTHILSENPLRKLIEDKVTHQAQNYFKLINLSLPKNPIRSTGIDFIRESLKIYPLEIVKKTYEPVTEIMKNEREKLFGAKIYYFDQFSKGPLINQPSTPIFDKTFLHLFGQSDMDILKVKGKIHLTEGPSQKILKELYSKVNEYLFSHAIDNEVMALSFNYDLLKNDPDFYQKIVPLRNKILNLFRSRVDVSLELKSHLKNFFDLVQKVFPRGAYIKNYDELTTGDLGNQITSFHYNLDLLVDQFRQCQLNFNTYYRYFNPQIFKYSFLKENFPRSYYDTACKFIIKLLFDPSDLLIQERLKVAKTPMEVNLEFRIDFVDSESVNIRPRYTYEYLGNPQQENSLPSDAKKFLNGFFNKLKQVNPNWGLLSGGADVVKLENGEWKIIEFNFGGNSGSMYAGVYPVYANEFMSNLSGVDTALIKEFKNIKNESLENQRNFIAKFQVVEELWYKPSYDKISRTEIVRYLRDLYLDEWSLKYKDDYKKGKASALELIQHFKKLIEGLHEPHSRQLPQLVEGMEKYFFNLI